MVMGRFSVVLLVPSLLVRDVRCGRVRGWKLGIENSKAQNWCFRHHELVSAFIIGRMYGKENIWNSL